MHETWDRHSVVQERLAGAVQELKLCERDVTSTKLELDCHLSVIVNIQDDIMESYV